MLKLVDTDRLDSTELPICNSPVNDPLDRSINAIPACRKNRCCLLPTQTFGPGRKEQSERVGVLVLTTGPGNSFGGYPALLAVDSLHGVDQEYRYTPERNELKLAD